MEPDFPADQALVLYADRIREVFAEHGMHHPRVAGLVGSGRPLPAGIAIELYVEVAGAHDWMAHEKNDVAVLIENLIGHPVVLSHCPPGQERILPGETVRPL